MDFELPIGTIAAVFFAAIGVTIVFKMFWRVAGASEAIVITGMGASLPKALRDQLTAADPEAPAQNLDFKVVVGKGVLLKPGVQRMTRISLGAEEALLQIESVTTQGIPLDLEAVVLYKVGDDVLSIAKAVRRFNDREEMRNQIHNVLAGHLRAVIGTMTVENIMRNREELAKAVRAACGEDLDRLGLRIDSFQIQKVDDPTGYISNLAAPEAARVEKEARIARANADQEATQREAEATARKAESESQSRIQQAAAQANADTALAQAQQAGPLAEAQARQAVVVQEAKIAELEADRQEKRLETEVRKPADAEAYRVRVSAEAARDAAIAEAMARAEQTKQAGLAEAEAAKAQGTAAAEVIKQRGVAESESQKAQGLALAEVRRQQGLAQSEADRAQGLAIAEVTKEQGLSEGAAVRARAEALAENQDAVITQQLVERLPEVVTAAAASFDNVGQFTVLNGAEGVNSTLMEAVTMGISVLPVVRSALTGIGGIDGPDGGGSWRGGGGLPPGDDGDGGDLVGSGSGGGARGSARGGGFPGGGRTPAGPAGYRDSASTGGYAADSISRRFERALDGSGTRPRVGASESSSSNGGGATATLSAKVAQTTHDADEIRRQAAETARKYADAAPEALDDLADSAESLFETAEGYADRYEDLVDRGRDIVDRVSSKPKPPIVGPLPGQ